MTKRYEIFGLKIFESIDFLSLENNNYFWEQTSFICCVYFHILFHHWSTLEETKKPTLRKTWNLQRFQDFLKFAQLQTKLAKKTWGSLKQEVILKKVIPEEWTLE